MRKLSCRSYRSSLISLGLDAWAAYTNPDNLYGQRTQEAGKEFVKTIKHHSDGQAPLFLSDGWPSYPEILARVYSHEEPVPYSGRGRPRKPIRVLDENLK